MEQIKIGIADDHRLFAEGLSIIFEQAGYIDVAWSVDNGEDLLAQLSREKVDLVILDISMPRMNGLEAAARMQALHPATRILVVTMNDAVDTIRALLDCGVQGIVLKNAGKAELLLAVSEISRGNTYFSPRITQQLAKGYRMQSQDKWQLTRREREVLQLIYEGLTTAEIAERLFISSYTVETHRKNLFVKSGVNKSALLIRQAQELGYLKQVDYR